LQLRPYQLSALAALRAYLQAATGYPLIEMATGTGKSLVIAGAAHQHLAQHPKARIVIFAPRLELIEQDVAAIKTIWPAAPVGIVCEGLDRHDWEAPIVVGTVNSVYRRAGELGARDLVFVDEAHLIPHADEGMFHTAFSSLLDLQPALRIVGLTASPYRLDSGRLDEGDDRLFDQVVLSYGISDAIADGWLAPLIAKAPDAAEAVINTAGVHKVAGEFNAGELERAADQAKLVTAAADEIVSHAGRRFSWLVFCCGIEHARHVCEALQERGVKAATVTGMTPDRERREIIAAFRRSEIDCLTGADIFITGFDIPQVDLIALLRPTLSTSRYVQMLGRGTRKAGGKKNCLVLDFGGNVARHGPVDSPSIRTARSGDSSTELVKVCPACKTFNRLAATHCCECDREFERKPPKPTHAARAADLPILSADADWLRVRICNPEIYVKTGRPESFKINYTTAGGEVFRDWMAFAHGPGARWHAVRKWQQLGGSMPAPNDAREALARWHELTHDVEIITGFDGKYWQVTQRRARIGRAA
jgi:DNA repair protein RadD